MGFQWKLTVGAAIAALAFGVQAESFDVVVIGSGGAGLSAGIMAKEAGATNDSPEIFFQDTMKGGHNLNNPALLKVFTEYPQEALEFIRGRNAA